ncbi:MAG: hypothetical protein IT391_17490 [Nitrospira sp.]|nr:hypothetical protein [Nitrospira sp.]
MRKNPFKNMPRRELRRYRKFTLKEAQEQAMDMVARRRKFYGQDGVWQWCQQWRSHHGGA